VSCRSILSVVWRACLPHAGCRLASRALGENAAVESLPVAQRATRLWYCKRQDRWGRKVRAARLSAVS